MRNAPSQASCMTGFPVLASMAKWALLRSMTAPLQRAPAQHDESMKQGAAFCKSSEPCELMLRDAA